MASRALLIGATGSFGRAAAEAFLAHGWSVAALHRDPSRASTAFPDIAVEWVKGDAMSPHNVSAAAAGARLIVHAANPPGYKRWRELAMPMLASSIAAAKASGARLLFPGN